MLIGVGIGLWARTSVETYKSSKCCSRRLLSALCSVGMFPLPIVDLAACPWGTSGPFFESCALSSSGISTAPSLVGIQQQAHYAACHNLLPPVYQLIQISISSR